MAEIIIKITHFEHTTTRTILDRIRDALPEMDIKLCEATHKYKNHEDWKKDYMIDGEY